MDFVSKEKRNKIMARDFSITYWFRTEMKKQFSNRYKTLLKNKSKKYKKLFLNNRLEQLNRGYSLNIFLVIVAIGGFSISIFNSLYFVYQIFSNQFISLTSLIFEERIKEIGLNETLKELGTSYNEFLSLTKSSQLYKSLTDIWFIGTGFALFIVLMVYIYHKITIFYNSIEAEIIIENLSKLK